MLSTMKRLLTKTLLAWLDGAGRKPLILRGARQVGKTWLARDLARRAGRDLVELNFERDPGLAKTFQVRDPRRILDDLSLMLGRRIDPATSLLFLDEIQAARDVLAGLRWFHEELPALPVIAAGSLLEFALADEASSMPVGRVTYRHVEPMDFGEYLLAHDQGLLAERLECWRPGEASDSQVHELASQWFHRFSMVGGMPGVVALDVEHADPEQCRQAQIDLMTTYRDDFAKYARRREPHVLDGVLGAVARQIGQKFVYARAGGGLKQAVVKPALELLERARLVTIAPHSSANGVPLGAEVRERNRKALLLDVGLLHALLGTPARAAFPRAEDLGPAVRGQIMDQIAGQHLRSLDRAGGSAPSLYYWQRGGGRPGEIDQLIQVGVTVVPVEVKAGAAGAMKSLHQFMHDKSLAFALRVDTNPPSIQDLDVGTTQGDRSQYRLLGLPAYMLHGARSCIEAALRHGD